MMMDRKRALLLAVIAVLYVVHAVLTVHQFRLDALPSLDDLPDLSTPSGRIHGPDYALPIARVLAMLGLLLLLANVIANGRRDRRRSNLHLIGAVLKLVGGALALLFGPMALGSPWYGTRFHWAGAWYWTAILIDVLVIALTAASALFSSTAPRRHDALV